MESLSYQLERSLAALESEINKFFWSQTIIVIFLLAMAGVATWCYYVYVTSKREWYEEDVKIRRAEVSYNLARAEQVRMETLALKDRLEKSGVETKSMISVKG